MSLPRRRTTQLVPTWSVLVVVIVLAMLAGFVAGVFSMVWAVT